jgi:hypothetical protein
MYEFSTKFLAHMQAQSAGVSTAIGTLCAVGVLAYCGEKIWQSIANNEPVSLYPLVRPFLMAFLCLNFSLVTGTVDGLLSPINSGIKKRFGNVGFLTQLSDTEKEELAESMMTEEQAKLAEFLAQHGSSVYVNIADGKSVQHELRSAYKRLRNQLRNEINMVGQSRGVYTMTPGLQEAVFEAKKLLDEAKITRKSAKEERKEIEGGMILRTLKKFIGWLASLFYALVHFGIQCLRVMYLTLLTLMGPIAMALSIFPGLTGNFKNWLIKYISVYLWLPVLYFVDFTIAQIQSFSGVHMGGYDTISASMVLTMQIIGIFTMMSIPSITSWMVQGGETGQGLRTPFAMMGAAAGAAGGIMAGKLGNALGFSNDTNAANAIKKVLPTPGSSS